MSQETKHGNKCAVILFGICLFLTLLYAGLSAVQDPEQFLQFSSLVLFLAQVISILTIVFGLSWTSTRFPIVGLGFASLAILDVIDLILFITNQDINFSTFRGLVISLLDMGALLILYSVPALLFFLAAYREAIAKRIAKAMTVLVFVAGLVALLISIVALFTVIISDSRYEYMPFTITLQRLLVWSKQILYVVGAFFVVRRLAFPNGRPQKTVTDNEAVPEASASYCDMTKHILLLLFTFGVWYYIWIYRTTAYTNRAKGEEKRDPTTKLLLCLFVPFYSLYWTYKTAQRIDAIAKQHRLPSEIATPCLVLAIFAGIVTPIIIQDKINTIEQLAVFNARKASTRTSSVGEVQTNAAQQPQAFLAAVPANAADELRHCKALLDEGLITEEDYQVKKKQLLQL